jgi:hypothetical protein
MTQIMNDCITMDGVQSDYLNWLADLDGDKEWKWNEWSTGHYNGDAFFDESMEHYNRSFLQFPFKATEETRGWVPKGHSWYTDQFYYSPVNPPYNSFYTELDVDGMSAETAARMIGTNGSHFNWLTEKHNCLYIWYNGDRGKVEIWGDHDSLAPALNGLKDHLRYISKDQLIREDSLESYLTDIWNSHEGWVEGDTTLLDKVNGSGNEIIRMVIGRGGVGLKDIANDYGLSKVVYDPISKYMRFYGGYECESGGAYAAMTARFCDMYSSLDSTFAPHYSGGSYDDEDYSKYGYHSGW